MISLIIASPDKSKRREFIQKYCQENSIDPLDITIIERETALKQNAATIGIEEIKNMQKKLFLKPFKSPTKAVILDDAHLLTVQAQNALLKVLEEPPRNTIIILLVDSKESLLPTIISRCQIIELKDQKKELTEKEIQELKTFIENLPNMTIGEKFKKAELLSKDKENAQLWLTNLIMVLHEKLLEHYSSKAPGTLAPAAFDADTFDTLGTLKHLQSLHTLLKTTNVNPRFAIENTLLLIQ